ncbi:MAG: molybdopterin synthase catalytic subunit MoaE [Rhodobiaceae bacterium]|nr:MAG: molybdopterin synthase catalytic subunit MoaE [Rhodobiaceae bacterium]
MVRVQQTDFDPGAELDALVAGHTDVGAAVSFVGYMRDRNDGRDIETMTLEHYPGMAEKALEQIETEAQARWPLKACLIIHRVGPLKPGDRIVLVITTSSHRQAAFEAGEFLMDWLKTKAPFWKKESGPQGETWVSSRSADENAAQRWTAPAKSKPTS